MIANIFIPGRRAVPARSYAPGSTLATMLPVAEGRHRQTVTASAHHVAFSMSPTFQCGGIVGPLLQGQVGGVLSSL